MQNNIYNTVVHAYQFKRLSTYGYLFNVILTDTDF